MRAEARVPTPKSERYAKQTVQPRRLEDPPCRVDPSARCDRVPRRHGDPCRMTAEPDLLVLAVEATDPADLAKIQQIVGRNIERFASRENLKVPWMQD
ncbi:MAG: DUF2218 domain-containing protein [Actinomycetota bacterium]|nr:DUF2218 domain-containing protein [Actinomycetota bacterium]